MATNTNDGALVFRAGDMDRCLIASCRDKRPQLELGLGSK